MSERAKVVTPDLRTVWREQVRAVALGVRRELTAAGFAIAVPTLVAGAWATRLGETIALDPGEGYGWLAALLAVLFPLVVWKGEARFGDSQLWSLPVEPRRHALMKVASGWVVLMAFLLGALVWLCAVVLLTGGSLGADESRLLLVDRMVAATGQGGVEQVHWTTPWWQWITPFTAATTGYLLGSALLLATPRPWWWVGGGFLLLMTLGVISEEFQVLNELYERLVFGPVFHPLGLDTVMTGGWDSLTTAVQRLNGEWSEAWRSMPGVGRWIEATALWGGVSLGGLLAATQRHRTH